MTPTQPQVTQADRNAAVRLLEAGGQDWQAKEIRLGQADHFPLVQAFANHRQQSENALRELIVRAVEIIPDHYVNWHADARAALDGRAEG